MWDLWVAALIERQGVGLGETEKVSHSLRIYEAIGIHQNAHGGKPTSVNTLASALAPPPDLRLQENGGLTAVTPTGGYVKNSLIYSEGLGAGAWDEVRTMNADPKWWDFTGSSPLAHPSPALTEFVTQLGVEPRDDPLVDLMTLSSALNDAFEYRPGATSVDSTIDDFLLSRRGVCQDYTHVLVAIARSWGVPTRYVSGYLYLTEPVSGQPGSAFGAATHAWAETRLPGLGWVGLDPTNRSVADHKYVRIAIGRDYQDVPPTRGVIEGGGDSQLEVDVRMTLLQTTPPE